jgi:hypothetical protein
MLAYRETGLMGIFLHEAYCDGQKPFVLGAPIERVLWIIRTIPSVNLNILIRRHLLGNITLKETHHPMRGSIQRLRMIQSRNTNLLMKLPFGLGFSAAKFFSIFGSTI